MLSLKFKCVNVYAHDSIFTIVLVLFHCILDKCCQDRRAFIDAWGNEIRVVLDPFHALQRVVRAVKKHDVLAKEDQGFQDMFYRKLRCLIRRKDDRGEVRQEPTAPAQEIRANIKAFLKEYDSVLK